MNDLTTAFAVPESKGSAQPMIFQSILQHRVGEIAERGCIVVSGSVSNIVPKPMAESVNLSVPDDSRFLPVTISHAS